MGIFDSCFIIIKLYYCWAVQLIVVGISSTDLYIVISTVVLRMWVCKHGALYFRMSHRMYTTVNVQAMTMTKPSSLITVRLYVSCEIYCTILNNLDSILMKEGSLALDYFNVISKWCVVHKCYLLIFLLLS